MEYLGHPVYITTQRWQKRKACGRNENQTLGIALSDCKYTIEELLKNKD